PVSGAPVTYISFYWPVSGAPVCVSNLYLFLLACEWGTCLWTAAFAGVSTPNPTITVKQGATADLRCTYTSDFTKSRVEWKFVNNQLETFFVYYDGTLTASYVNRATSVPQGIILNQITSKDAGEYSCEVTSVDSNGQTLYGEAKIQLLVIVAPSQPMAHVPNTVRTGSAVELRCVETQGYPPPTFTWYQNKAPMPPNPQNATYTIDPNTGVLKFRAVAASDSGDYYCKAANNEGEQVSAIVRMNVQDVNVGGIVAAVVIVLLILALIGFGLWYAYSRGYLDKKGNKKVIYSQPSETRSDKNFQQTSSFLV
uniref:Junctional adhesion molecule A n=1 Tax=Xenopus tropicalis TaxID=8364 RepID=A0A803J551_XENTR